jgi:SOS response regulatory protein OraA/RecX
VARRPPDPDELTPAAARALVLRWLGQRELTVSQARQRLQRRHYDPQSIGTTLEALAAEGLLDDNRAARARARHDVAIKRRGPGRVLRQVQALGVDRDVARAAVADAFADIDQEALLADALDRRLRGQTMPSDRKALARLYGWLVRQGFEADRVSALLRRRT